MPGWNTARKAKMRDSFGGIEWVQQTEDEDRVATNALRLRSTTL